jgi:hypothetical protein
MLHIEPDCWITGTAWQGLLLQGLHMGADMAASHRKPYGPLHVCPSAWRTDVAWPSFRQQLRGDDVKHPRFAELFSLNVLHAQLQQEQAGAQARYYWTHYWDTGQKAWFSAAVRNAATLSPAADGFRHYWGGSHCHQQHPDLDGALVSYLIE